MKRFCILFVSTLLLSSSLSAAFEDSLGTEELIEPDEVSCGKPFAIGGQYDWIGLSHFTTEPFKCNKIGFQQGFVFGRSILYYQPRCNEGLLGEVGYSYTRINWNQNPFFNQDDFNTVNVALTLFSERLDRWLWTVRLVAGYDVTRNDFWEATVYDIMSWGRYEVNCRWGVHFGFLALTGMRIDNVYPILGFDWKPNEKWEVNAVFPVNMAIVYNWTKSFSFALAGRLWNSRFRLGEDEPISEGLLKYTNSGIEMQGRYQYCNFITAQVRAGYSFGGQLKVANRNYQDKMHFDFEGAPYLGGELLIEF